MILIPALWLIALFLVPFLIVLKISLSQTAIAQPPYTPVLDLAAGWQGMRDFFSGLSFGNYMLLASDSLYLTSYLRSLLIAAPSTLILLLIGYPIAYGIARAPRRAQPVLVAAIVLPFLTAFLIRIYAWVNILQREGLLNDLLIALGLIREPLVWLSTDTAIFIGIVYSYLPFMVLPLYASLERVDETLLEAAADLGCPRWKAFWLVTVPLSLQGVVAGALLCFIPIAGEFVIPDLLGGSRATDDRPDTVDRILPEQGLAGGVRRGSRAAVPAAGADHDLPALANARIGAALMRRGLSAFNVVSVALGLAFLYLPIAILVIYSFNASRLVTVWGGWSTRWYVALLNDSAMLDAAWTSLRIAALSATAATVLGTLAAVALVRAGRFPRPHCFFGYGLRAAGDAGGDHRPCRCCCCSSRSTSTAAFGPWRSRTPP